MWHRKTGVDCILTWTSSLRARQYPSYCQFLWMALWKCLVQHVRTTRMDAWMLHEVKGRVSIQGSLMRHCPVQLRDYLAVFNPLQGQLIPGEYKEIWFSSSGFQTNLMTLSTKPKKTGFVFCYLNFTYFNHKKRNEPPDPFLPHSAMAQKECK